MIENGEAIALSAALGFLLLITTLIWFIHRKKPFYKMRSPLLMTLSQFYSYGTVCATLFFMNEEACEMMAIFFSLLLPFAMGPMLMMIPQFLLNAKVNTEKINRAKGIVNSIWRYKFLTRTDVQGAIIILIAFIHLGIYFLISQYFSLEDNCYRLPLLLFDIEMLIYFLPYGWLMHLIKNLEDPFHIRAQLISSWIVTAPITVITLLYPFVLYSYFDFRYVYMSSAGAMFIMMYLLPLFHREPKRMIRASSSEFNLYVFNRSYDELLRVSERNWSSENILFINAVQEFRSTPTTEKAVQIYDLYIKSNADMWINLSHSTFNEIEKRINARDRTYDPDLFESAEVEIMTLIRTNILPYI